MIPPHGGKLLDCTVSGAEREKLAQDADRMPQIPLTQRELADLEMIACGAMSPLKGFMTEADYRSVVDTMRLTNGLVWSIPVVFSAKTKEQQGLKPGAQVALVDDAGHALAVMALESRYEVDPDYEAQMVLRTTDDGHPGVQYLKSISPVYLGGDIRLIRHPEHRDFARYRLEPKETRVLFDAKGWKRIAAFQTRNPIHRAHEYLQKCVMEFTDGLLIHPLVGETKGDDIPADVRMRCYEALLEKYYQRDRVVLSVFPAAMRYGGPREAIFHALVRKNYGCTHFIVGRDHAGVGDYYGTYDAHTIFGEFEPEEIDITPLFFDHAFYCKRCGNMATAKTCPHDKEDHVFLSGRKVRQMLLEGKMPPPEFTRPEVAEILGESARKGQ
ncbi:MAG: sulfate adenylyltransferase [Armatimonadetes bacterium]|nr:sulfate adenylyltransferase [Armatimonadota bacterium]NIM24423.1 sulfate adenylyltransferase [Armatimonadota bacterium]NIM68294.1 sulfate adenylyltransferase [Armatimonadota bacterium]NIM76698.1 sulfate adenylyltransferase [Armatimonadota bacterium]NIN06497.1 sulfate adenylyltransferase [Armatimonadota bacterium]